MQWTNLLDSDSEILYQPMYSAGPTNQDDDIDRKTHIDHTGSNGRAAGPSSIPVSTMMGTHCEHRPCFGPARTDSIRRLPPQSHPSSCTPSQQWTGRECSYNKRLFQSLDGSSDFGTNGCLPTTLPYGAADRFIPQVRSSSSRINLYHSAVSARRLTSAERISRTTFPMDDPFAASGTTGVTLASSRIRPYRQTQRNRGTSVALIDPVVTPRAEDRQVSVGNIWAVAGISSYLIASEGRRGIEDGRGGLSMSGTTSPLFSASFLTAVTRENDLSGKFDDRLAQALGLDRASRMLQCSLPTPPNSPDSSTRRITGRGIFTPSLSDGNSWETSSLSPNSRSRTSNTPLSTVPSTPFRVLDAPELRDDFYCTLLAYDPPSHSLAVALHNKAYIWTERHRVVPVSRQMNNLSHITTLGFSSSSQARSLLATGRYDGTLTIQALAERKPRYIISHTAAVSYISWSPSLPQHSPSGHDEEASADLGTPEYLLVGDELGHVHFYSIEWSKSFAWRNSSTLAAGVSLLAIIEVHTQQICGIAWSPDGQQFATGANDNACYLFSSGRFTDRSGGDEAGSCTAFGTCTDSEGFRQVFISASDCRTNIAGRSTAERKWLHKAAVKAIAFCPWQPGLLATGGGSNDQCIHFFHTSSGTCLATIHVAAQVTSLLWSTKRREICATFGYAAPDHPYRVATFSWPECRQITAIPWSLDSRALHAVAYAGLPAGRKAPLAGRVSGVRRPSMSEGTALSARTEEEGCVVVASSNESIQFHEIWSEAAKPAYTDNGIRGSLGGSDILESLEGIEKEAKEVLR